MEFMVRIGGRGSGKSFTQYNKFCERAAELQSKIELAKMLDEPHNIYEKELNEIYSLLDRGRKSNSKSKEEF